MKRLAVPGRTDWRQLVSAQGCTWHDDGKEGCWREDVVWELTRGETDLLMRSAAEVLSLYQQAADHVVRRGLWNRLGFETEEAAIIQASLERRDEAMLGRFDFLMDESGQPRLLEFNADIGAVLDWAVDRCYRAVSQVSDSCFLAIAALFGSR